MRIRKGGDSISATSSTARLEEVCNPETHPSKKEEYLPSAHRIPEYFFRERGQGDYRSQLH